MTANLQSVAVAWREFVISDPGPTKEQARAIMVSRSLAKELAANLYATMDLSPDEIEDVLGSYPYLGEKIWLLHRDKQLPGTTLLLLMKATPKDAVEIGEQILLSDEVYALLTLLADFPSFGVRAARRLSQLTGTKYFRSILRYANELGEEFAGKIIDGGTPFPEDLEAIIKYVPSYGERAADLLLPLVTAAFRRLVVVMEHVPSRRIQAATKICEGSDNIDHLISVMRLVPELAPTAARKCLDLAKVTNLESLSYLNVIAEFAPEVLSEGDEAARVSTDSAFGKLKALESLR